MHKCNFYYAAMSMMPSQILKFVDFTKTQKSKYLENEILANGALSNQTIHKLHIKGYFVAKNSFVAEIIFKPISLGT